MKQDKLKLSERFDTLYKISQFVQSESDLEKLNWSIYQLVCGVIALDAFYIGLYYEKDNLLDLIFIIDEGKRYPRVLESIGTGFCSRAILKKETVILNRTVEDIKSLSRQEIKTIGNRERISKSIIVSPLIISDQVVGVVSAQSYGQIIYSEAETKLLSIIGSQVAGVWQNAWNLQSMSVDKDELNASEIIGQPLEFMQTEKLRSVLKLAFTLAHEMNQPLTGISGYCALIREEIEEDHPIYKDIKQIEKQAQRLEQLINKFQTIAQLENTDS
ncbi:MAG: histidine kinase dimerization/phospho-acceptor domain-containing protein [bacterium]